MIVVYDNVINKENCQRISSDMLSLLSANNLSVDNTSYTNGSLGFYNLPSSLDIVADIEHKIKKHYGDNIVFQNTYTRVYKNGNDLKIHTDRPGLDITLSVCVYSNLPFSWPIHVSSSIVNGLWETVTDINSLKEYYQTYHTPVGTGVACLGTKNPHWRDTLICETDQIMIQAFYHWKYI